MKTNKLRATGLLIIAMLFCVFSCQETENVKPQSSSVAQQTVYTNVPLTDKKLIAQVQAIVSGETNESGRTSFIPPTPLPSGYNYTNMQQVTIAGTNWVTLLAPSLTVNNSNAKEMIAFYSVNGVVKNWIHYKWRRLLYLDGYFRYSNYYTVPQSLPNYNLYVSLNSGTGTASNPTVNRPAGACGQQTIDCFSNVYTQAGWLSVGLTILSMYDPALAVGIMGTCAIGCLLE